MAVVQDLRIAQCLCCSKTYDRVQVNGVHSSWVECPTCGVYRNCTWYDKPIENPEQINQDSRLIISDIKKFVPILAELKASGPLYDVCSYIGALPFLCSLSGIHATGNEISPGAIAVAKMLFGIDLEFGDLEELPQSSGIWHEVIFHHGIEHVREPDRALAKASEMLQSGGHVYLAHPVMRDFDWVLQYGDRAHHHEWTFEAFGNLVRRINSLEVVKAVHGKLDGPGASQSWILRKI